MLDPVKIQTEFVNDISKITQEGRHKKYQLYFFRKWKFNSCSARVDTEILWNKMCEDKFKSIQNFRNYNYTSIHTGMKFEPV